MGWVTFESGAGDLWEYVSLCESHDYVARLCEEYHGVAADEDKIREITASFAQGRMYFENARTGSIGVKPLLLYYGILALCGGLVLLKNPNKREMSRSQSHGFKPVDWKTVLGHGVNDVLKLRVKFTGGSLTELVDICWNKQVVYALNHSHDVQAFLQSLGPLNFSKEHQGVTLADLIARSRYSGLYYPVIIRDRTRMHQAWVLRNREIIAVSINSLSEHHESLAERYKYCKGVKCGTELKDGRERFYLLFDVGSSYDLINTCMPVILKHEKNEPYGLDGFYMIEDLDCGNRPGELIKLYMISYILGMLARYFPSKWMSLMRNDKGAIARPLLVMGMNAIESKFIGEFAQQVAVVAGDKEFFAPCYEKLEPFTDIDWDEERFAKSG